MYQKSSNLVLIPVIVGMTGLVKNNLKQHLKAIKHSHLKLEEVQLCAVEGTISILRSHQGFDKPFKNISLTHIGAGCNVIQELKQLLFYYERTSCLSRDARHLRK